MNTLLHHPLGRRDVVRFDAPVHLHVDDGDLWVTIDGEPDDIHLSRGEDFDHDGHAPLLATPLGGPALLSAEVRERRHWFARWL